MLVSMGRSTQVSLPLTSPDLTSHSLAADVLFFDESIEAKINRYTFRLHKRDTPFLLDSSQKHTKTFVSTSVDVDNLDTIPFPEDETTEWIRQTQRITRDKTGRNIFHYDTFPKLKYLSLPPSLLASLSFPHSSLLIL
jgi:hypothetical protein